MKAWSAMVWMPVAAAIPAVALEAVVGDAFFRERILPVLESKCYNCHSERARKIKGGLRLDSRRGWEAGGDSGHPAIVSGRPEASPLFAAVKWEDEDTRMPPKERLADRQIADIRRWIEMGAPDLRLATAVSDAFESRIDIEQGRKFWCFRPPVLAVPRRDDSLWPRTAIDQFLWAAMKEKGLRPVADADRRTLIRRVSFDLTGLPPTPDEIKMFLTDRSGGAIAWVIDRYLNSPRFGERWGRHWLDVARYAETSGRNVNLLYREAWRYRDYVIRSFNADKPYDQFIREQLAGDLLSWSDARDQAEKIVATGYLAIGPKYHDELDRDKFLSDLADEQISAVTQGLLSLTVACARCHDHKTDPIAQRDYYALAGIFLSSETLYGTCYRMDNWNHSTLIELGADAGLPSARSPITPERHRDLFQTMIQTKQAEIEASFHLATDRYRARFTRVEANFARAEYLLYEPSGSPRSLVMGVLDRPKPIDASLLVRGEVSMPSVVVPRGLARILSPSDSIVAGQGSGRLMLANSIVSRANPLTARVMANRVWSKLFGRGLVATPDDFGNSGALPSHPGLLDHLALCFMDDGWSVKALLRRIMLSRAYQLSSAYDGRNHEIDPENVFLWRMSRRRLEAEAIRDAMLAVSGGLDLSPPTGSLAALIREDSEDLDRLKDALKDPGLRWRSVFLPVVRGQPASSLAVFDCADSGRVCGQRDTTNVPAQSLFLLNNDFVLKRADAFAERILRCGDGSLAAQATRAFQWAFGREPSSREWLAILDFIQTFPAQADALAGRRAALAALCQSLFACGEFRYFN